MANIGTSNYAAYHGVPAITVVWLGRSGSVRTGTIYSSVEVTNLADESNTVDNSGEIQAVRTRNDRLQFRFTVKPVADTAANALVIAGDLPKRNTVVTISAPASETDLSATGTNLSSEASKSFTPEDEAVVNLTVIKHIGKTFVTLS